MKNFEGESNKMLQKKQRWNSTLDKDLCKSVLDNIKCPVYTQGVLIYSKPLVVNNILCTVRVIYNPYMVISRGWSIAGCLTDTISQIVIFVDDDYMRMTDDARKFIMFHEIGHIAFNHKCNFVLRNIKHEYEADAYAVSNINVDAIQVLTEISLYVSRTAKREIKRRISFIR